MCLQLKIPVESIQLDQEIDVWYDFAGQAEATVKPLEYEMILGVLSAEGLSAADSGGTSDPYVIAAVRVRMHLSFFT